MDEDMVVTLRKRLHNLGPNELVDVSISASVDLTLAPGCSATPDPTNPTSAELPVSVPVIIDEMWTIHCDTHSDHVFTFENQITIEDPGMVDPVPGNNSASTRLPVDFWEADLEMLDQQVFGCDDLNANTVCDLGEPLVDAPTQIPVGENVPIMVQTVVQNGGPFGPVNAAAETIVAVPTGCHVTPLSHLESIVNLPEPPPVLEITLKAPFTIRCDGSGQHTFSFDNAMDDNMEHVRDPDAGNNTAHTELTVTAS